MQGIYACDLEGVLEAMTATNTNNFKGYLDKHVYTVASHEEYLEKVVGVGKMIEMRRRETIREGYSS